MSKERDKQPSGDPGDRSQRDTPVPGNGGILTPLVPAGDKPEPAQVIGMGQMSKRSYIDELRASISGGKSLGYTTLPPTEFKFDKDSLTAALTGRLEPSAAKRAVHSLAQKYGPRALAGMVLDLLEVDLFGVLSRIRKLVSDLEIKAPAQNLEGENRYNQALLSQLLPLVKTAREGILAKMSSAEMNPSDTEALRATLTSLDELGSLRSLASTGLISASAHQTIVGVQGRLEGMETDVDDRISMTNAPELYAMTRRSSLELMAALAIYTDKSDGAEQGRESYGVLKLPDSSLIARHHSDPDAARLLAENFAEQMGKRSMSLEELSIDFSRQIRRKLMQFARVFKTSAEDQNQFASLIEQRIESGEPLQIILNELFVLLNTPGLAKGKAEFLAHTEAFKDFLADSLRKMTLLIDAHSILKDAAESAGTERKD